MADETPIRTQSDTLQCWFNLSYASFCVLPRVLMEAMPVEWQDKMGDLLNEIDDAYPNIPDDVEEYIVCVKKNHKFIKPPRWLIHYRHPDIALIESFKNKLSAIDQEAKHGPDGILKE